MASESRTAKSIQNVKVALLFYILNLVLQFFSRKIFLDYLGSEVLGLNTTAQNLLSFLNLAELGIGTAVAYNLYKPLYEHNYKDINTIVSIQGWLYRRIAYIVIGGACILMCFFPIIFAKAQLPLWYAYGSFIALLISALLGYFVNYKQIVLSADQKEYKITLIIQGTKIIKVILQILAVRFLEHGYIWWIGLEITMTFTTSYILNLKIKKEYPWLCPNILEGKKQKESYPAILTKTKQLFFHRISGFILGQSSPLIIYAYASLTLVAIYGNYMLIVTGATLLVNALLNSIGAGIGNLVAEGNKQKIKSIFWELTILRMWIASIICFGMYMLGHSFISIWVGKEYILPQMSFYILIAITFIDLSRTNDTFLYAYGLFQYVWAPIAEAILNLGLSIILGYYWGLTGILLGVFTSLLTIIYCWKPYFLYKYGFKENIKEYILKYAKYLSLLAFTWFITCAIIHKCPQLLNNKNFIDWSINATLIIVLYSTISLSILYITDKSSKDFTKRIFKLIKR